MNTNILVILILSLSLTLQAQNQLINNGAVIKIQNGADFRINNGGIANKNSGVINNSGTVYLDDNFNQTTGATYTGAATSWLTFEGASNQNLTGDAALSVAKLKVTNGNRLILGTTVNVSTEVDLNNNGNIELGSNRLVLGTAAVIVNYDANNYIITNNTGFLQQEVGGSNKVFPIGNSSYNPTTLSNTGTLDNFQVRVVNQVQSNGTSGTVQSSNIVNRTWLVSEETLGGSDVTMTLQWATADEMAFDRSNSGIAHHLTGNTWDYSPSFTAAASVGADWAQTRSGITSFSPFVVNDVGADLPIELLSFNANRQEVALVQLDWTTASELNNEGFYVERMLQVEHVFETVGFVAGKGTTTATSYYELLDENSYTGVSYYRLRQVDVDGTTSYSAVKAVSGSKSNGNVVDVFPNPIHDYINIRISSNSKKVTLRIYDAKGSLVVSQIKPVPMDKLIQLNRLETLAEGSYMLSIMTDDGEIITKKIIKK